MCDLSASRYHQMPWLNLVPTKAKRQKSARPQSLRGLTKSPLGLLVAPLLMDNCTTFWQLSLTDWPPILQDVLSRLQHICFWPGRLFFTSKSLVPSEINIAEVFGMTKYFRIFSFYFAVPPLHSLKFLALERKTSCRMSVAPS